MMTDRISTLLVAVFAMVVAAPALAQQVSASASINPQRVYVGDAATYTITISNAQAQTPPSVGGIANLKVEYRNSSQNTSMSFVNGRQTSSNTHNLLYAATPAREGSYIIPAQTVVIGGVSYTTNQVQFVAVEPPVSDLSPLSISTERDTVYLGEPVRLRAQWQVGEHITEFKFVTEETGGIEWTSGPQPSGSRNSPAVDWDNEELVGVLSRSRTNAGEQQTLSAERWFVPTEIGTVTLGPVAAVYDVQVDNGRRLRLRSATERRITRSNEAEITVRPLPVAGQPEDFDGLVGRYTAAATAMPLKVRVGDPITLTYEIRSEGPMGRIGPPDLDADPGIAESFKLDPEGWHETRMGQPGVRRYTTTIRALRDSIDTIPPLGFAYFDTREGEYQRAESRPIPLLVDATREVTAEDAIGGGMFALGGGGAPGVEQTPLGDGPGGILANTLSTGALANQQTLLLSRFEQPVWGAVMAAPPAGYFALLGVLAVRRRADPGARRRKGARRAALARLRSTGDPERAIRVYLAMRFGMDEAALTEADCERLLKPTDPAIAEELATAMLFGAADRYGDRASGDPPSKERVAELIRAIDRGVE